MATLKLRVCMFPGCSKTFTGKYAGYCSITCRKAAEKIARNSARSVGSNKGRSSTTWDSQSE